MQNKNITAILPLHKINEDYKTMLLNAVNSVDDFHNDVTLLIVCPSDVKSQIDTMNLSEKLEIKFDVHNSNTDFISQVNRGIQGCETEWFTILEVDDEYQKPWLKSMNEYVNEYPLIQ